MDKSLSESLKSESSNSLSLQFNLSGIDNLPIVSKSNKDSMLDESISEDSDQESFRSKKFINIRNCNNSIPKDLLIHHTENKKPKSQRKILNPLFRKVKNSNYATDQDIMLVLKNPEEFAHRFLSKYEYSDTITCRRDRIKTAICNAIAYINETETQSDKSTQTDRYSGEFYPVTPVSALRKEFSSLPTNEVYPHQITKLNSIEESPTNIKRNIKTLAAQRRMYLFSPIDCDINNNDCYGSLKSYHLDNLPLIIENDISPTTSTTDINNKL